MQINSINNNAPNFKGIFVKYESFDQLNTVTRMLKYNGFTRLGFKNCYVPKNKHFYLQNKAREIRMRGMKGYENEFGVVNFPWLKKACFIASKDVEPKIYDLIERFIPDARLDMLT